MCSSDPQGATKELPNIGKPKRVSTKYQELGFIMKQHNRTA
jgi:hypothetical protein